MKTIILLLFMFVATLASAQTIDTAIHTSRAAKVNHFKNNPLLDTGYVTHVGITYAHVNLTIPSIRIDYIFINDASFVLSSNSLTLIGADYLAWYNAADKINYFFGYIRTHVLDNTGSIFITYQ